MHVVVMELDIPELKKRKSEWGVLVEERMKQGKQLKTFGDAKMSQHEVNAALLDFVHATLRFFQAAEAMEKDGRRAAARSLLEQTGRYAIGCASAKGTDVFAVTQGLLYYLAAVCFGSAFSMTWIASNSDHKHILKRLRTETPLDESDAEKLKRATESTENVYKSLEKMHLATKLTKGQLNFPESLLRANGEALVEFVDRSVKVIREIQE